MLSLDLWIRIYFGIHELTSFGFCFVFYQEKMKIAFLLKQEEIHFL